MKLTKYLFLATTALSLSVNDSGDLFFKRSIGSQTSYLFSHGLGGKRSHANYYRKYKIISDQYFSFDYPDSLHKDRSYASLAQEEDLACLRSAYKSIYKSFEDVNACNLVLMGVSRGASSILNFAALDKPDIVKAIVAESPFDSIDTILDYRIQKDCWFGLSLKNVPFIHSIAHKKFQSLFPRYKKDGIRPIDIIANISQEIPILIICSKEDEVVPWYSSARLYKELRNAGHDKVHLLIVDSGQHAAILVEDDGDAYQHVVHAFYKKYNLPYNSKFAELGANRFVMCQPDTATLEV